MKRNFKYKCFTCKKELDPADLKKGYRHKTHSLCEYHYNLLPSKIAWIETFPRISNYWEDNDLGVQVGRDVATYIKTNHSTNGHRAYRQFIN